MLAVATKGLYWPTSTLQPSVGGGPPLVPPAPSISPVEPTVLAAEMKPKASADDSGIEPPEIPSSADVKPTALVTELKPKSSTRGES